MAKKTKGERPQNKNLIELQNRPPEEAQAIRSKGGKVKAQKDKEKKALAEMVQIISDLPIKDKKSLGRLTRMGVTEEDGLTQKMLIADALVRACKQGNTYALSLYLELTGETAGAGKENNLLEALQEATKEDIDTDDIPEIQ